MVDCNMVEFITNKEFEEKFDQFFKDSIEVAIGSAFMNLPGLELLTTYLEKASKIVHKKIRILLSENFHEKRSMRKSILEKLRNTDNIEVKIYSNEDSRFHAKIFIFSTENQVNILSGSYNLTGAGIGIGKQINKEGGYAVSGKLENSYINDAISFFNENWKNSMTCDNFLVKESMRPEPNFQKGDSVYVIANPEKKGLIQSDPISLKGTFLYSVFFSIDEKSNYKEEQLAKIKKDEFNSILNLLIKNKYESTPRFIQAFTVLKLDNPLTDNLYAFLSSRTEFNSYQFKPVLKFLNSPFQRLLIADEVGVGKTIEAGIIYTELKARKDLERVLIVCPNALMPKWKSEMKSRFDENFEILSPDRLKYILNEVSKGVDIINLRCICSLQLLRMDKYLDKIKELSLNFDLVIVDEAHHLRNKGNSYKLGMHLSYNSDAMIFLTATPLQLGNEDFFNLMHILLPDEFKNFDYFQKLIEPNQYINATYSLLKTKKSIPKDALEVLQKVESTAIADRLIRNPNYIYVKNKLNTTNKLSNTEVIHIQNKLNQLNPLSYVYTRTKKKEVMNSPKRNPHFIHVIYSKEEKKFYDMIIEYARFKFKKRNIGNSQGIGFATIMVQRQVASCIPAMISYLKELLKNKQTFRLNEDDEYIADDSFIEPVNLSEKLSECEIELIKNILSVGENIGDRDSKFDGFIKTIDKLLKNKEITGIMVFSFFRKTLEYLKEKLSKKGYKVGLIYGGVDLDEREKITEQLRNGQIQILLSSEVGGEGLDFQFCNCMVNYDLPWNPMRVEQRIGRLDRYGQQSPKILIYNFSVEGTIETTIFGRLYQRIKIFEKYIGELEGILGKEISDLTKLVVSTKLTPEEEEEKITNIQEIIELKKIELKDFEKDRVKFVGQDDFFTEEVTNIQKSNRFISKQEIMNFFTLFLKESFPKVKVIEKGDRIFLLKSNSHFISFLTTEKRALSQFKRVELSSLIKKLETKDIEITFDSKTACYNKNIEFITLRHPIIKCIISSLKKNNITNTVGKICIKDKKNQGTYLFFTYIIKINAAKSMLKMHTIVININDFKRNNDLSNNFNALIFNFDKDSEQFSQINIPKDMILACQQKALENITSHQDNMVREMKQSNDFLINSQIESQTAFFNHKIKLARKMMEESNNSKIIKMKNSEINRLNTELEEKIHDLEKKRLIDISFDLVAGGLLCVKS